MPRKRRESEIRDGEIAIRDRKPSVSRPRCFGWMASQLLAVADSRSWELGRGPTGDRGGRVSELTFTYGITDGIEGSQAGWSAAMADGLRLLGLNPLRETIDGAPKFWGPGAVEPLALGQNRACPTIYWKVPLYLTWH